VSCLSFTSAGIHEPIVPELLDPPNERLSTQFPRQEMRLNPRGLQRPDIVRDRVVHNACGLGELDA
jgi:hypothetical protein